MYSKKSLLARNFRNNIVFVKKFSYENIYFVMQIIEVN